VQYIKKSVIKQKKINSEVAGALFFTKIVPLAQISLNYQPEPVNASVKDY
jgi:hypothetical protein